jgi:hypothetical protein
VLLAFLLACAPSVTGDPAPNGPDAPDLPDTPVDTPVDPASAPLAPPVLPRLTTRQLRNALDDLLGAPLPSPPLQVDTDPFLFTHVGAVTDPYSELGVQQLEEAANTVAAAVFADPARRAALVGCAPASPGDACAAAFLDRFGRRAWRRPLTAEERARYLDLSLTLADGDPWTGLQAAVTGLLQAPDFVYRVEQGEPDPADPTRRRYTGWEMASRLSFLLWDTLPDEALLDAAGTLTTREGVEDAARRLLADPRARRAMQAFFDEYLDLASIPSIHRDPTLYPTFTPALAAAMATELRLLADELTWRSDGDLLDLFSTRRTFVNDVLAAHYGVTAPGASAVAFVPAELPADGPRSGLLTRAGLLTLNAHEASTSPTLRGKFLRERVLCSTVPAPPPDVNTQLVSDPTVGGTLREQLARHREDPSCATCHDFIDPPGLVFEGFDAAGAIRALENGAPVDTTGDLDGVALRDAAELSALLADDARVGRCLVRQVFRFAHGRLDGVDDRPAIDDLEAAFTRSDHRLKALLLALVTHDSFRLTAGGAP